MSAWRLCRWRVARGSRLATQAIPKDDNLLISYFVRLSLSFMHTHSTHCVLAYLTHFYWQRHTHRRGKAAGKKDETKKRKEGRAKSFPKLDPNVNRRLLGFMTSRFIGNEEWQPVFFFFSLVYFLYFFSSVVLFLTGRFHSAHVASFFRF